MEANTIKTLTDIPLEHDIKALLKSMHIEEGSRDAVEFEDLLMEAYALARPKALYKESYIESRGNNTVTIDGVIFTSRALRANLDKVARVFPYIITCGRELDQIDLQPGDLLKQFWLDTVKASILKSGIEHFKSHLNDVYMPGKTSTMNPGAGDADVWPINEQVQLFSLFGDVNELIGVELTDSFLMIPNKTVSGIQFPAEIDFQSCQVCRRQACPLRRAPLDEELWKKISVRDAGC